MGHHTLANKGVDPFQRYLTTLRRVEREDLMALAGRFFEEREKVEQEPEEKQQDPEPQSPEVKRPSLRPSLR